MFKYYVNDKLVSDDDFLEELITAKMADIKDPDIAAKLADRLMFNMQREAEIWEFPAIQSIGHYPDAVEFTVVKDSITEWYRLDNEVKSVWSYDIIRSDDTNASRPIASGYERNYDGTYDVVSDFMATKEEAEALGHRHLQELTGDKDFDLVDDLSDVKVIAVEIPVDKCTPITIAALKAVGLI
jgi:hypothetical protein